jgi:polyphosphate glucokinase
VTTNSPRTLAIDIGGTHIKAAILGPRGALLAPPIRRATPDPATPKAVLRAIAALAVQLPAYDRISAGFPGYIRAGRVQTAPNLGTPAWRGFRLDVALARRLKKPARVLNDADVQGLGVIDRRGLECVLTLGTGIGSALFLDGKLLPHLELGQHPVAKQKTYDAYLGDAALKEAGRRRWNRRLRKVIEIVRTLTNFDTLHLGGGNARVIDFTLPPRVRIGLNLDGLTGGFHLWDAALDGYFRRRGGRGKRAGARLRRPAR